MFYRQYYSELGKLLYSIANVDGVISEKEKKTLKELVRKELAPSEKHTDKFGTDAAYYTEIEFDILEDTDSDSEAAFDSFITFLENHHTAVDGHMREATLKITKQLANIYHKPSKKGGELIKKLEKVLKALPTSAAIKTE